MGERERPRERTGHQDYFCQSLLNLKDIPIVGDVAVLVYFWGVELVKNQETKENVAGEDANNFSAVTFHPRCSARTGFVARTTAAPPWFPIGAALISREPILTQVARCGGLTRSRQVHLIVGAHRSRCGGRHWNTRHA